MLFLQRSPEKSEGGKWGVPLAALEKGEDPKQQHKESSFEETDVLQVSNTVHPLPLWKRTKGGISAMLQYVESGHCLPSEI